MKKVIILSAGGTGGHVFPAVALAHEFKKRGHTPILMLDHRSKRFANAFAGLEHHYVYAGTLSLSGLLFIGIGIIQALLQLRTIKPDAVIGFGGYPSLPATLAGIMLGRPLFLHEQNSYMGKTNRWLARFAKKIGLSFPTTNAMPKEAKAKSKLVGNPVRSSILQLRNSTYSTQNDNLFLLVTGGSQGSAIFSKVIPEAVSKLPIFMQRKLHVTQQCREDELYQVQGFYERNNIKATVAPFLEDMRVELARADLVIARSGASTCAELAVAGRPSILVPYPSAMEDHQTTNAEWLKNAGGAIILPQNEFTVTILSQLLQNLFQHPEKRKEMADAAHEIAMPDAEGAMADLVLDTLLSSQPATA